MLSLKALILVVPGNPGEMEWYRRVLWCFYPRPRTEVFIILFAWVRLTDSAHARVTGARQQQDPRQGAGTQNKAVARRGRPVA